MQSQTLAGGAEDWADGACEEVTLTAMFMYWLPFLFSYPRKRLTRLGQRRSGGMIAGRYETWLPSMPIVY